VTNQPRKSVLRIPKRHTPSKAVDLTADDGRLLMLDQSLRDAVVAGLIVVVLFSALWAMASTLISRIFPWVTVVLGIFVGLIVRLAGRGLDWRFPVLAAVLALLGALVGNIVVAAAFTAVELDTTTFTILRAVTSMTWPVFFDEVISAADIIYALFSAALAAFYASRRLSRSEYHAVRKWQDKQQAEGRNHSHRHQ
jgi:hypothetical protein